MAELSVFSIITDISFDKKHLVRQSEETEGLYDCYIVNKGLSFYADCVLQANEMNRVPEVEKIAQYDYLINSIRPKKRWTKWIKKTKDDELALLQDFFKINKKRAIEVRKLLSDEALDTIKKKTVKGG